ncbi:MAG: rhamnulokinase [Candidatus Aminicenantes bacterium]|nr:rhamnulokinase [Candidatus Aminicenantes bacterium]
MEPKSFLAFDLGAESGRTILGRLSDGQVHIRELTRFLNSPVRVFGHLHWNIYGLFEEIKKGMKAASAEAAQPPESLAVDTWGVDFGLLTAGGTILGLPYAYRDDRTNNIMDEFFKRLTPEEIYGRTGVQFMPFNSLFQLFATARDNPSLFERVESVLFMPDLFTYLLTGEKASEFTIASTSQILDPRTAIWDKTILSAVGLSPAVMPDVLAPGTLIGDLLPAIADETGLPGTPVVAAAGHDTAAAVAAVPAQGEDWAYICSGTWSLLGVELPSALISPPTFAANFTNEGGIAGTIRFLKNIAGLWLLQQCRREWSGSADLSYDELTRMAGEAPAFQTFIDPDCPDFLNPPSMSEAIRCYCLRTGQVPPESPADTVLCILESLALKYRSTLDELRLLTGKAIRRIHVIGGGSRNGPLCQFTADATGLTVLAGPAEATATGNILVQAMALGYVGSLGEIREIVRRSVDVRTYRPSGRSDWDRAYDRFREVTGL